MSEAVIGFLGVIVGGLISIAGQLGNNWNTGRKAARFLAIRMVCVLDTYGQRCVDVVNDDGSVYGGPLGYTPDGQEIYEPQVDAPAAPAYPDDIDWQSIPADLAYQLLEFPNTVWETERYVSAVADNDSPPYDDFFEARQSGYALLGQSAIQMADKLRRNYNLPKKTNPDWYQGWDIGDFFEGKIEEFRKLREDRRKASIAILKDTN